MEQLSLLEQFRAQDPGTPDVDHIRRIARDISRDLALSAPVDFDVVTSYQGISAVELADIPWAGCLVEERGELTIKLRESDTPRRQRFSWGHELAHTFFPGFRFQPQYRCNPVATRGRRNDHDIEALCDLAAAELLFPAGLFGTDLADRQLSVGTMEELADEYVGSLEATAHRMIDLTDRTALMVVLKEMYKPSERSDPHADPKLRVSYAFGSGSWPYVPRWKSADPSSGLVRALDGEVVDETASLSELTGHTNGEVHMSAKLYPYHDNLGVRHRRVIAIYR